MRAYGLTRRRGYRATPGVTCLVLKRQAEGGEAMQELVARVRRALEDLGETEEAVAEGLKTRGVRGVRCDGGRCPLAVYVRAIPGAENAVVLPYHVVLSDRPETAVPLTPACVAFTHGHDIGRRWPGLTLEG
jgi:hypothetical protein